MAGLLALCIDVDLSGGHTNKILAQNVTQVLVDKLVVKFESTILQETVGYHFYKTFEDLFLPGEKQNNMIPEGIQSEDFCKIRSNSVDNKTFCIDAENKLNEIYGTKYHTDFNHQILTDHVIFYPQALYNDLVFEVTISSALQVVRGSNPSSLKYKLTNIQLR